MRLVPKNWREFQHYKDRNPPWIRLHRGLLDNKDFNAMPAIACKVLVMLWLVAADSPEGTFDDNADDLAFRLRLPVKDVQQAVAVLKAKGFLLPANGSQESEDGRPLSKQIAERNGFGSRHISDKTKRAVWERDGGKCCGCGSSDDIEFDHIHPVSKGGNSDEANVQLLCRPCNRKKRAKSAEQVATPAQPWLDIRTSETETETETEALQRQKAPTVLGDREAVTTRPEPYKVPSCPYDDIAKAYAEACPQLPQLTVVNDARKGHMSARWREVCAAERFTSEQGMDWFRWYFAHVKGSPFLTGNGKPNRDGRVWRADFDWLMLPTNFAKVVEGRYHGKAAA